MPRAVCCICLFLLLLPRVAADEDLYHTTMPLDIETSDYYELEAWCERLGLDAGGTRKDLENRLRAHYGLGAAPSPGDGDKGSGIIIESAYNLEYFTLDIIEEKYIRLSGGVVITLEDRESSAVHEIQADNIVFNQDNKSLTARGNIEYILTRNGESEVFRGDSLSFDTESWEGVFFKGISEREREVEDKTITFYYSGDSIYRSEDNVVTLEDGLITSSERVPPNYSISASKIWVLAPGEWAISNAVLYIGRVPVFYIPVFFKPGDPLFFHPSLGYRQREGYFVQSTTYLLGEQKADEGDTTISFLQTVGTEDLDRSVDGLFLREKENNSSIRRKLKEYSDKTGSYVKLLADAYSRLGYLIGIDGDIQDLGFLDHLTLYAALGRSRTIFETAYGYTPFYLTAEGTYASQWDSSYFLNLYLPFRYGLDIDFSMKAGYFTFSGNIPAFSDPYFEQDFLDRKERTNWSELIGFETGESTATSYSVKQSVVWNLKAAFTPRIDILDPYIDTFSIKNLESSMYWKSREISITGAEDIYFYYPDSVVLPDFTGTVKGVIFSSSAGKGGSGSPGDGEEEEPGTPGKEVRSPWEQREETGTPEEGDGADSGRAPAVRGDIQLPTAGTTEPFSHSLSYVFNPDVSFDTKLDSDDWAEPDDIEYIPLYSLLSSKGSLVATYNAAVLEKMFVLKAVQTLSAQKKDHYPGQGLEEDDITEYASQDLESTYLRFNESLTCTSNPFVGIDSLAASRIAYSLKFLGYENSYNSDIFDFEENYVSWTDEYIQEHKVQLDIAYKPGNYNNTIGFILQLPPLTKVLSLSTILNTGPLSTTIQWSAEENEAGDLIPEPLTVREKLSFFKKSLFEQELNYDFDERSLSETFSRLTLSFFDDNVKLKQTVSYDLLESEFTEATTEISLFPFTLSYSMKDAYRYDYSFTDGWIKSTGKEFVPYEAGFSATLKQDMDPFWKNRIFLSYSAGSSWKMNLQQFTENLLTFNLDFSFLITDFLDLKLKTRSENTATHLYIPGFMAEAGRETVNPLRDLLDSFNFFDDNSRRSSHFNLKSISLEAVHKLEDWDLSLSYSGEPELNTTEDIYFYEWQTTFTIMMQWNPIPELKTEIERDESGAFFF